MLRANVSGIAAWPNKKILASCSKEIWAKGCFDVRGNDFGERTMIYLFIYIYLYYFLNFFSLPQFYQG